MDIQINKLYKNFFDDSACFLIDNFVIFINTNATFLDLYRLVDLKLNNNSSNELYADITKNIYIKRDTTKLKNLITKYNVKSIIYNKKYIFKLYLNSHKYNKINLTPINNFL